MSSKQTIRRVNDRRGRSGYVKKNQNIIRFLRIEASIIVVLLVVISLNLYMKNRNQSVSGETGSVGASTNGSSDISYIEGTEIMEVGAISEEMKLPTYDVDMDEVDTWFSQNKSLFSENQILTAQDNETFRVFLYRWKNLLYDTYESDEILLTKEEKASEIPLFLQTDDRWGYFNYGEEVIGTSGCGPTSMAMVASGLLEDASINPEVVAEFAIDNDLYMWGTGTMWDIYEEYSKSVGITCQDLEDDYSRIPAELAAGNPVICSVRRGVFTYGGHFIVLTGIDEDGNITVNDPMSAERSSRTWTLSEFSNQIKNAWSFHL